MAQGDSGEPAVTQASPADVSVVIVSWNCADLLAGCLHSLARHAAGQVLEVWVVDNASSDQTLSMLRDRFPQVRVIANRENRGFAAANNQAIRQAAGRYVFILNPDTVVEEGAVRKLREFLEQHAEAGMAGPRIHCADGSLAPTAARRTYSLAAALWLTSLRLDGVPLLGGWLRKRLMSPYDFNRTQPVEAISGAAMLVRRELLQRLDGFGECFSHCGEDIDLCVRVLRSGCGIYYVADATVWHYEGASRSKAPVRTEVNSLMSNHRYFVRCFGRRHAFLFRLMVQGLAVPRLVIAGVLRLLSRRESADEFRQRLAIARHLLQWRDVQ
jgi:hypothetical protein